MSDNTGLAEALLGLDGFKVLEVTETQAEVTIRIETTASLVACDGCGVRAESQDRTVVHTVIWPLSGGLLGWCGTSAGGVVPNRAVTPGLGLKTHGAFSQRCLLTNRCGEHACRQVGRNARPVAQLAEELGVCWQTVTDRGC